MPGLELRLLNVGRGDCLLIRFPDASWGVVDCGQRIAPYEPHNQAAVVLNTEGPASTPIRFILATHPHADHDGGIRQLLHLVTPRRSVHAVYYSGVERKGMPDSSDYDTQDGPWSFVSEAVRRREAGEIRECRALYAGCSIELDPPLSGVEVAVLGPPDGAAEYANSCPDLTRQRELCNNLSVVLKISYADRAILLPGDVQGSVCRRILTESARDGVRVIKGPHHGRSIRRSHQTLWLLMKRTALFL